MFPPTQAHILNASADNLALPDNWFLGEADLPENISVSDWAAARPHLFSATRVWIDRADLQCMAEGIEAIEQVLRHPDYQALSGTNEFADSSLNVAGVLFGYDFHLTDTGPKLIEINTNAGGAFLTACLGEAWQHLDLSRIPLTPNRGTLLDMFSEEWRLARAGNEAIPPGWVLIVDENPPSQYLYPEFVLCQSWLRHLGWKVAITDPATLSWDGGTLRWQGDPVSMVYNRLTDFSLSNAVNAPLLAAYLAGAAVLTPHPYLHARYADKSHLVRLADAEGLSRLGFEATKTEVIRCLLLPAERVSPANAETLWASRKNCFFKPLAGYGSKAAYRGDKLTRRVFEDILAGQYIAQTIAPPPERVVKHAGENVRLKFDLRAYTYRGQILGTVARLYQGQTTNFRTSGGGFAPVYCAP